MTKTILALAWILAAGLAHAAEVPKELQDIWCADRIRLSGLVEAKCFRFGADYMTVYGDRVDAVWVEKTARNTFHVTYRFADVVHEVLMVKHRNYIMARDRDGAHWGEPVRYNRGNPYAEYFK